MTDNPGRRRNIPGDPTAEPASDPVPTGNDVVDPDKRPMLARGPDTPRRYDQPADRDPADPSDGAMPKGQI